MDQMSKRSSNRRELRVLGSFRNFTHRQDTLGSFRNSVASALHLPSSVYEISEIGLGEPDPPRAEVGKANWMADESFLLRIIRISSATRSAGPVHVLSVWISAGPNEAHMGEPGIGKRRYHKVQSAAKGASE